MGTPLLQEVLQQPITAAVVAALVCIYLFLQSRGLGYEAVGLSYDRAIRHGELWRVVSAQLAHVELLHLFFNCSSLWSLGFLEQQACGLRYAGTSLLLLLLSGAVTLAIYHALTVYCRREHFAGVTMVGYSAVLFGMMTIHALSAGGSIRFAGLVTLPSAAVPVASLILTSLIVRRASFVGHLSGILCGAAVAWGAFDWLDLWWGLSLCAWAAAATAWHLARTRRIQLGLGPPDAADEMEAGQLLPAGGLPSPERI